MTDDTQYRAEKEHCDTLTENRDAALTTYRRLKAQIGTIRQHCNQYLDLTNLKRPTPEETQLMEEVSFKPSY